MLVYDWMWWGQLTNQNLVQRCAEVHGGVRRGAQRCTEVCRGVCRGGAHRGCTEGCAEGCEVLYPLYMVNSLRTLKVHHCLSLVTIGCP